MQDLVGKYSQQMVKGMLQLLSNCPSETAHLRKELLIAAKHILTTDLRSRTYTYTLVMHELTRTCAERKKYIFFYYFVVCYQSFCGLVSVLFRVFYYIEYESGWDVF